MLDIYNLPEFLRATSNYKVDTPEKHTSDLIWRYYHMAYYQMLDHQKNYTELFQIKEPSYDTRMEHFHRSWSCVYSMYVFMQICLDSITHIKKVMGHENNFSDNIYPEVVVRINDIANNIIKCPIAQDVKSLSYREPVALYIGGCIEVSITDGPGVASIRVLDPMVDFKAFKDYLEYTFSKQQWEGKG